MLGHKERGQLELFMTGSLRQLIPDDYILAKVDRVLDLTWLRAEVSDLYCEHNGRPGIDPEVAVRLMLAGFLLGIVHDRRLMREAQVNLGIRWFIGYGLHEALPDHSFLTRIRQRRGVERFRRIFERTVEACIAAKIAKGDVVHVDASLIRADVSWESLAVRHVEAVAEANEDASVAERDSRKTGKFKKVCVTDPDATMATSGRNRRLEPSFKQHAVVDDVCGVVLDVEVTTGEINEGQVIIERIDATIETTGVDVEIVTADAGYAYARVFGGFERRGISAVIPTKAEPIRSPVPMRRFRYDAKNDTLKCPRGKTLRPTRPVKHGRFFYSKAADCRGCGLARLCLSKGRANKAVVVGDDYPALLRARRRREKWTEEDRRLYQRHRWRSEGFHGEAKSWHGLARAVRRGLSNMKIQSYLTAAAINLKRLAVAFLRLFLLVASPQATICELRNAFSRILLPQTFINARGAA
ncbi:transposase [Pseudorhizobium tarimense]|uniref:Transposase n=1 Tax=Pseudorhizobium tarimense TaxID=1079109 RepID=A0ABV2HBX8_9HYPH|nr:transposase [Pseudorhizobium tarimense]MCJ8521060.1 transposase [Pseudorhizobium tarimense]